MAQVNHKIIIKVLDKKAFKPANENQPMDEIVERAKFFIDEVHLSLVNQNVRSLKSDLHSLLHELFELQKEVRCNGTEEQLQAIIDNHKTFTSLESGFVSFVQKLDQEHVQGKEKEFFEEFTKLFAPHLNTVQQLLEQ